MPVFKKGKGKGGGGGGGGKKKGGKKGKASDDDEDDEDYDEDDDAEDTPAPPVVLPDTNVTNEKMLRRVERLEEELSRIRGGAISQDMFNHLNVKAHGSSANILEVAQISMKGGAKFSVAVFDPELTTATAAAIRDADMGLNPSVEGSTYSFCFNLLLPVCLLAFSDTTWHESNHHLIPSLPPSINQSTNQSIITRHNTHT
jgi:hypothetical protein